MRCTRFATGPVGEARSGPEKQGVVDRFRSMPMAPSAFASGRGVADLVVAVAELAILAATALLIGWRAGGGAAAAAGAFGLLMAVVWPLVITLVFLPLAVRRFRRLSR